MNNRISNFLFFLLTFCLLSTTSITLFSAEKEQEESIVTEDITLIRTEHIPPLLTKISSNNPFATKVLRKRTVKENLKKYLFVDWIIYSEIINEWYTKNLSTEKTDIKTNLENIDWITLQETCSFLLSLNSKESESSLIVQKPADQVIELLKALYKIKNDLHIPVLRPLITQHFLELLALNNNAQDEVANKAEATKIILSFTQKVREAILKIDPVAHQHLLSQLESMQDILSRSDLQQLSWQQTLSPKKAAIAGLAAGGTIVASATVLKFIAYLFSGNKADEPRVKTPAEIAADLAHAEEERKRLEVERIQRENEEKGRREEEEKRRTEEERKRREEELKKQEEDRLEQERIEKERVRVEEELRIKEQRKQNYKALKQTILAEIKALINKPEVTIEELRAKITELEQNNNELSADEENREDLIAFSLQLIEQLNQKITELTAAAVEAERIRKIKENEDERREQEARDREAIAQRKAEERARALDEEKRITEGNRAAVEEKLEEYKISENQEQQQAVEFIMQVLAALAEQKTLEAQQAINVIHARLLQGKDILKMITTMTSTFENSGFHYASGGAFALLTAVALATGGVGLFPLLVISALAGTGAGIGTSCTFSPETVHNYATLPIIKAAVSRGFPAYNKTKDVIEASKPYVTPVVNAANTAVYCWNNPVAAISYAWNYGASTISSIWNGDFLSDVFCPHEGEY